MTGFVLAFGLAAAMPAHAQHSAFVLDALVGDIHMSPAGRAPLSPFEHAFTRGQLLFPRVQQARTDARFELKRLFHERGLPWPADEIFLRSFKRERVVELWVRPHGHATFALLKEYPVCSLSGTLGPKKSRGDLQVPEGYYDIDMLNPQSDYYLSLHVSYPNVADRARAKGNPGGDIYIHGGCESIGCLAVTDEGIKELYWMSVEVRAAGQNRIPIHIFPSRLDDGGWSVLAANYAERPDLLRFWESLRPGFDHFERTHRLLDVRAGLDGLYRVAEPDAPGATVRGGASR
jgi:murein L,D-transpeptidase YafK